jgi:GntR family transcriptional regulator
MQIHLDHHSGEPIYRQIVEAIKFEVARGKYVQGDKLPSIRELADTLGINMRTVVKAYEELCHAGLAVMQQGRGVFITAPQGVLPATQRRAVLIDLVQRLLAEAQRLGATSEEVKSVLQQVAEEMGKTHERK